MLLGRGPGPGLGVFYQACGNRVLFDVQRYAIESLSASHPMIEGFICPEAIAFASENLICRACGRAFQALRDTGKRNPRFDENVDVICHDDIGVKLIEIPFVLAAVECFHDAVGYARVLEPERAV